MAADTALFEWEPDARQAARAEAETWLAASSRPDDVLFGYEPLYLGAWERSRGPFPDHRPAGGRPARAPRDRGRRAARTRRLGPRRERAEQRQARLEIEQRFPDPDALRGACSGPFLVLGRASRS